MMILTFTLIIVLMVGIIILPFMLQLYERQEEQKKKWIEEQNKRNK